MPLSPTRLTLSTYVPSSSQHTSAETAEIKNAITCGNGEAVQEKLNNAALSAGTLQNLLTHALEKNSAPAIKKALLEHKNCNPESALDLAVQYNDTQLAKQALQNGADPEKITLNNRPTDGMRALLNYARRLNKLYPPGVSSDTETDLDRALRNGLLDDNAKAYASSILDQKFPNVTYPRAWQYAVKHKQLDMQRAILLLWADMDPYFRVLQDAQVTDKGVAEVMKEMPYFSPKRGWPENFNCTASFSGKKAKIECRHLVEHRQQVQQQHPQGKFDDAQFASLEAITAHVSYDTEAKHDSLLNHATEVHLLHNHDFGLALAQQLNALAIQGALPQSKFIALNSTGHVMSVRLTVKEEDNKPRYVAEFFDPTWTTSHVRVASASLHTFETLKLENFVSEPEIYEDYYPASENVSTMFVRPSSQNGQAGIESGQGPVKDNRMLTSSIKDEEVNAAALHHMLAQGFSGNLRLLKNKIKIDKELLAAKSITGVPGLFKALQNGHADTIKAFGELLELVPPTERAELLAAKRADGTTGLFMALRNGHADTIKAFGELLKLVPPTERAELLVAKNAFDIPGLSIALHNGHADAVEAFGELLDLVPSKECVKLLTPEDARGISGLAQALKHGKLDALDRYISMVMKIAPDLPPQARSELLTYIRKSHTEKRLGMKFDLSCYSALKKQNPALYERFKNMEKALEL